MVRKRSLDKLERELLMERYYAAIRLVRKAGPDERERLLMLVIDPSPEMLEEQLAARGLTAADLEAART